MVRNTAMGRGLGFAASALRVDSASPSLRHKIKVAILWCNLAGSAALIVLLFVLMFDGRALTTFRLDAHTSSLVVIASAEQPQWSASIPLLPLPLNCVSKGFRPSAGSEITLEQSGEGPVKLRINATARPAGVFECTSGEKMPSDPYVYVDLTEDMARAAKEANNVGSKAEGAGAPTKPPALTLRFAGDVRVGSEIDKSNPVPSLLERGELLMETQPLFGKQTRVEAAYRLDKGDKVTFALDDGEGQMGPAVTYGIVSLDRQEDEAYAFHVVARTEASAARVLPYGLSQAEPIAVAPGLIDRARAGARGILLGMIGAVFLYLLGTILAIVELPNRKRKAI